MDQQVVLRSTTNRERTMAGPGLKNRATVEKRDVTVGLSLRAILVGLCMVAMTCVLVCYAELVVAKIQIGFLQLPPVVVGLLFLLLITRAAMRQWSRRLSLARHEIMVIYMMMLLASMVSSRGLLQKVIPMLVVPNYVATPENGWQNLFFKHIKRWAVPWDPAGPPKQFVSARFYDALRPGERVPWHAWVGPLAAWGILIGTVFFAFLCLAVLLRRQWVDNERLAFPLAQLPLDVVRDHPSEGLLRNRLTWMGFALPALVFAFNGFHQWYPSVPEIVTDINLNLYMQTPPWNAALFFHMFLSFAAVGFFYLLPTDLLFSLWFLYLLTKVAEVTAAVWGYQPQVMPMYGCLAFIGYQIIGCYVVMVAYMVWAARPHLARIWRCAWGRADPDRDTEVLSYRTAFWGLILSVLLSAAWLNVFGMSFWLALFELLGLLFVVALVMARSTCESGMLMTETSFRPIDIYRMVGDVRNLGAANITGLAFLDVLWMRDQRGLVLTGFLDSMRIADGVRLSRRSLLLVFCIALLTATAVGGYLHLWLPYNLGGNQMYSYVYNGNAVWAFNDAATVLYRNRPPLSWVETLNFLIGVAATIGIVYLRSRAFWFPIHPLGYALCGTWTMMVFWFPCLVAWLTKVLVLRYGGMRLYARLRPFFLGMVLGEFSAAVLWTMPSVFWRTPTPAFPWP